jgi:hypothetical protein
MVQVSRTWCAWCWCERFPDVPFPAQESSTICPRHAAHVLAQHRALKARRGVSQQSASPSQAGRDRSV